MALYWNPNKQTRPPAQGGGTDPALERRVETLETEKAYKSEVQAVWDEMAAAYSEGVQNA